MLVIAGPCMIESEALALEVAGRLAEISHELQIEAVFKSSFDKANRTSASSPRGPGLQDGLRILETVRKETGLAVLTDVHETWQVEPVAEVVDILQIPAFLCRQTELVTAAAATGRLVNIKKGQFLAASDMHHVVDKAAGALPSGTEIGRQILLTERGTSFGHHDLVVDMRGLEVMRETGCRVIFDATHSVQRPGGAAGISGGDRRFIPALSRAAAAAGIDGLFVETHPVPEQALSDSSTSWPLDQLKRLLADALSFHSVRPSLNQTALDRW